ncbi:nitrogen regulation protein NR(I), partial [Acinetobacter baumannii]
IRIELPPLRARSEDIPALLGHYMNVAAHELGVEPKLLAPEAEAKLCAYGWPGNVRELRNFVQRAFIMAEDDVIAESPVPLQAAASQVP